MFAGMPANLSWSTRITAAQGEPMKISGTIYQRDGKTPAANVVLYVYHTDAKGYYTPAAGQAEARKHGQLRGWMKTDDKGRYEFYSIRPAPYPGENIPAHIHPIVMEPNGKHYWLEDYFFEDDPLVTAEMRSERAPRGGKGVVALKKNAQGIWVGHRDLVLGLHVPGY
jgi:protocatechuate 3,4-dioxygenase beta subunit